MELDKFIPGNILFVESHSLKTLNLATNETWLIAGKTASRGYSQGTGETTRFNGPFSFHQRNSTDVIILDSNNGCIRTLSRLTYTTEILAGFCTIPGDIDGPLRSARLGKPEKVVELESDVLAFTDVASYSIKKLDLAHEPVFGLAKRPNSADLIFTFNGGLGKVDLCNLNVEYLTQSIYTGIRDGPLSLSNVTSAVFTPRPETLVFLNEYIMILTGFRTHLL